MEGLAPKRFIGLNKKQLKQCGLSSNKIETLINIAQLFLEKEFPKNSLESFSDEEFEDLLIQIKGIGKWTCDIVKLFHLCRFDTFPEGTWVLGMVLENTIVLISILERQRK